MKTKKVPIFVEFLKKSFLIISLILVIYTVGQLVTFWMFSYEYEKDLLKSRYKEIVSLSKIINVDISETGFNNYLENLSYDDEYIRIYTSNSIYYESHSDVLEDVELNYTNDDISIKSSIYDFDIYMILTAQINIEGNYYNIQIVRENDMLKDFTENAAPIFIFTIILGFILSIIGAIYVSRNFINKLRILTSTMNEIKENGINKRAEISELNDEVDKVHIIFNSMMDELEESFKEQTRFVSDASHELKTPLTALHGQLSMLNRWGKNDKERLDKSLDICLKEVERLKKLVNDMLILSRAEKLQVNLAELESINIPSAIDEVIEQYKILKPNVKFVVNIDEDINLKININDFKQLLIIFIDNSIKYNNKETIEIKLSIKKEDDKIKLEVLDNGIGIPEDELTNVMKRFYKVDKSRVNNNSFGIGLSIANRIVKSYNAEIFIDSALNKYTKIKVYFQQ